MPNSYAELVEWTKKNPKKFGYNGIKGGMSGVAFVAGWVYAFGGDANKLGITEDELMSCMRLPKKTYRDYKNQGQIYDVGARLLRAVGVEAGGKR